MKNLTKTGVRTRAVEAAVSSVPMCCSICGRRRSMTYSAASRNMSTCARKEPRCACRHCTISVWHLDNTGAARHATPPAGTCPPAEYRRTHQSVNVDCIAGKPLLITKTFSGRRPLTTRSADCRKVSPCPSRTLSRARVSCRRFTYNITAVQNIVHGGDNSGTLPADGVGCQATNLNAAAGTLPLCPRTYAAAAL